ncbi:MAG: hypothetical protein WCK29_03935 [archaeon]
MVNEDKSKWVFEFVESVGNLEKALGFASALKRTVYPLVMDGKVGLDIGMTSDPNYIAASKILWTEFFEGDGKYKVPRDILDWLSRDKGAPWVVFGQLRTKAHEQGYTGGNEDFDRIIDDLREVLY